MNRDDADRAVKDLDGKDLRGKQVTVTLDDSVSRVTTMICRLLMRCKNSVETAVLITTAATIGTATIAEAEVGTGTTAATTGTGMIAAMTATSAGATALALRSAAGMTIVAHPGRLPQRGMMIAGAQGTMITEGAAMIVDVVLTVIILIVVVPNRSAATEGTTDAVTIGRIAVVIATKIGPPGKVVGVEAPRAD